MKALLTLLFSAALLLSSLIAAPAIVANNEVKTTALTKDEAKNIILGTKSRWENGTPIRLAVLKSGPAHEAAIQSFTARSPDQYEKHWKKLVFSGKGIAPDTFETEAELCAFVAKTPGAVGYVGDPAAATGVQVITVN